MRLWQNTIYGACIVSIMACASIGSPDGGRYDETPPKVLSCSPEDKATSVTRKKVQITFDEYVKLDNANEKVIVSPPQIEPAAIRADGKKIKVDLYDSLKANTTYTIDFSDAILDNNEGNPLGNYTYSFSTGDMIDTMEVAGTVLNAADLEPVKGILVGLYPSDSTFSDTLFTSAPFMRVSRTDGSGRFKIKGVKDGRYRAFAIDDKDGNFFFSQKSERIAFDTTDFQVSCKPDIRMDTIWRDSTRYDSIRVIPYTHYLPDDLLLMAFLEDGQDMHLLKTERNEPEYFTLYFTAKADSMPKIKGLNFDEKCLVYEASEHFDTITCWITDTVYYKQQDTISLELSFLETDSLGMLQPHTEQLDLVPKTTWAKKWGQQKKLIDDWYKDREKRLKKAKEPLKAEQNPYLQSWLELSCKPSGAIDPNQNPKITAKEPILSVDTTKVHFYIKRDSDWIPHPHLFLPEKRDLRSYTMYAEWDAKEQYRISIDSAAFRSVLGKVNKAIKQEIKVKKDEEFGSIFIHAILPDTGVVVQLISRSDKVVASQRANAEGRADFFYLRGGEYYVRCFVDTNGNGKWDTGSYKSLTQPEPVYYFPKPLSLKANWDIEQDWNVLGIDRTKQKAAALTKQKADKKKKTAAERNRQRDEEKRSGKKR